MVREIIHDEAILSKKSLEASLLDLSVAWDLKDTLCAHAETCVGMAANMIGELKNIIAVNDDGRILLMLNPVITKQSLPYETEEGCLSLEGVRKVTRFEKITVRYQDTDFVTKTEKFRDFTAEIIQHEIDHLNGILI